MRNIKLAQEKYRFFPVRSLFRSVMSTVPVVLDFIGISNSMTLYVAAPLTPSFDGSKDLTTSPLTKISALVELVAEPNTKTLLRLIVPMLTFQVTELTELEPLIP
ncbi:hypothetical protein D3C73_1368390 [compost metagenome]